MKPGEVIYLDYNATTPCDARVVEKMLPYFNELYANPANGYHRFGRLAARAIDDAGFNADFARPAVQHH